MEDLPLKDAQLQAQAPQAPQLPSPDVLAATIAQLNERLAAAEGRLAIAQNRRFKPSPPAKLAGNDADRWQTEQWLFDMTNYLTATGVDDQEIGRAHV